MSLKNSTCKTQGRRWTPLALFEKWPRRSLRLRLMFWYGGLMLLGLVFSGLLVLILASNTVNVNAQSAINSEAQIVSSAIKQDLSSQQPYWPTPLLLNPLASPYSTAGMTIEVFNTHGMILYTSDSDDSLDLDSLTLQKFSQGNIPYWYTATVDGNQALVAASPVYQPAYSSMSFSSGIKALAGNAQMPLIGVLLISKSLSEDNATLVALQNQLLLIGAVMLVLFLGWGWAVMGYVLRPLSEMARTARSIASALTHGKRTGDLSQRVTQPGGRDEMAQVVDAFNEMLTSIENSTTSQRRFIADASHELRAPLTTIQGNLAFLMRYIEDIPPPERHTMLADAHGETLRLASLVDELLLLARADAHIGQKAQLEQPALIFELDRTLLRLVRQMRRRLEIEGSTLKIEIGRIEPVRIRGDEESMRRIMVILLDNAIKYTPTEENKCGAKITVALERVGLDAVLQVSDTGIGIEATDLSHIFERFYRADQARSREGTGLGLAIAHTLVDQLNGSISAESTPGEGSTFRVSLPLA